MDYKNIFDNVLTIFNQRTSKPYSLIYGINNDSIVTDGLWIGPVTPNDILNNCKPLLNKLLVKYQNYYHIILIDRYNSYEYNKYYVNLKQPHLHNIQLKIDFYVIDYIYNYMEENEQNDIQMMKYNMKELNHRKLYDIKYDYFLTKQYIRYFKNEIKYMLILLNYLLNNKRKIKLNHSLWVNQIATYLY
jgi:hypothetical protein